MTRLDVPAPLSESGFAEFAIGWPQESGVASAVVTPLVNGPRVVVEGVVVAPLTATLFARGDLSTPLGTFSDAWNQRWQDTLSEPGSGSLVVANADPLLDDVLSALTDSGCVVRFDLHGLAAFAWLVHDVERRSIDAGEEAAQVTSLTGPGTLAVLEEALVFPSRGPDKWPIEEDRLFSWPAVDYDDSWWIAATELGTDVTGGDPDYDWVLAADWPDTTSRWLWARRALDNYDLPGSGYCYFRQSFTVPEGVRQVTAFLAADDIAVLFFDGVQTIETDYLGSGPWGIKQANVDVTPGPHQLAIEVRNGWGPGFTEPPDSYNPAGVLCSVHASNAQAGVDPTALVVSDRTWKIVEYPDQPPGMTPGEVLRHCLEEAQARGVLTDLSLAFSDDVDSAGEPWPEFGDISTKVGTDLLTFVRELAATYVDVWMEPASLRLWAWRKDGRGSTSAAAFHPPSDATSPASGNLTDLTHKRAF